MPRNQEGSKKQLEGPGLYSSYLILKEIQYWAFANTLKVPLALADTHHVWNRWDSPIFELASYAASFGDLCQKSRSSSTSEAAVIEASYAAQTEASLGLGLRQVEVTIPRGSPNTESSANAKAESRQKMHFCFGKAWKL